MKKLHRRVTSALPTTAEWRALIRSLSKKEFIFSGILAVLIVVSGVIFVTQVNNTFTVAVPARGGTMTEGIIGTPRFVNPLLAISDADKDLTALVYSGLMRKTPTGAFIPDLAESYDVSPDGLMYTFTLKNKLSFHDGAPVTADDVIYTVTAAKDPLIKSPKKVNWDGVTVTKKDDRTVVFTLKQRYASFIDATTIGILPVHLFKNLTPEQFSLSDLNIRAIGTGPYRVVAVNRTSSGIPSSYELGSFDKFAITQPYIDRMVIRFYGNEQELSDAFTGGDIDAASALSPETANKLKKSGAHVTTATLPRIFSLFFNQTEAPIFTDPNVTAAFDMAIDKQRIVNEVLGGYGSSAYGPIPDGMLDVSEFSGQTGTTAGPDVAGATALLSKSGWNKNADGILEKKDAKGKGVKQLSFSIATSDDPELKKATQLIIENLEALGVRVDPKVYGIGDLNQNIIRPRKYEALFFGQTINHDTDLYAFWHSSQRNDPGLNIALYASVRADKFLSDARSTLDQDKRNELLLSFTKEVAKDKPAVFVYGPKFIYATSGRTGGIILNRIINPSDRFLNVYDWFVETDHVWKVFAPHASEKN